MHGISLSYSIEHERNTLIKYFNENIGIKVQENEWTNIHACILGCVVVWEYREKGKHLVHLFVFSPEMCKCCFLSITTLFVMLFFYYYYTFENDLNAYSLQHRVSTGPLV